MDLHPRDLARQNIAARPESPSPMGLSPETLRTPEHDRHESSCAPTGTMKRRSNPTAGSGRPLLPAALLVASCFGIGGVALASVAPAIDAVTAQDGSKQKNADQRWNAGSIQ